MPTLLLAALLALPATGAPRETVIAALNYLEEQGALDSVV